MSQSIPADTAAASSPERRTLLTWLSGLGMIAGLALSYGKLGAFMGRFLVPTRAADRGWMFVAETAKLGVGDALLFRTPAGASINIARQGPGEGDFVALSSTCPHLGCQVYWEADKDRFFCPCHNGTFDPTGKATGGPPGEAGQELPRYPLKVEGGLLYVELPRTEIARGDGWIEDGPSPHRGPGHDPCLGPVPTREVRA